MRAIILNSGRGTRLGDMTRECPKCMTCLDEKETILSWQLKELMNVGVKEVVITTGAFAEKLKEYCLQLDLPLDYTFVYNEKYAETNYIYSLYCARDVLRGDDCLLLHGDLVWDSGVLDKVIEYPDSCVVVSSGEKLPDKDFKAVVHNGKVEKIGIEFFCDAVAAQPLYKLRQSDWGVWLDEIKNFCENGECGCYAENALNNVSDLMNLYPLDVKEDLCKEIDTQEDLAEVSAEWRKLRKRKVYMSFSVDVIHSAHIALMKKASRYGKLIVGVLSDTAVASYRRFPLVPYEERLMLFKNLVEVSEVVEQTELSYKENLCAIRPDFVVHGDDWREGFQKTIRDEVIQILDSYGGRLIEFPHVYDEKYDRLERRMRMELSMPDVRRGRLKKLLSMKGCINAIEAHNGITGLIAENTVVEQEGKAYQFDAMWVSSLCDSTAKGKPDIELVDMTSRFQTINDIMEVTTKPIIFDGDTGGLAEHFVYTVRSLERMGVSMVIIEDKTGLKKNSLFGAEVAQTQDDVGRFCQKIKAGKHAQKTNDFMIVARIESLILEQGMADALYRAHEYVNAGADGIMIHSRKKEPDEIFEFVEEFRKKDIITPIVVVPTAFPQVTEEEFKNRGVNIVIYANHLTRSGFPAMQNVAKSILQHHRAKEADAMCMSIKDIITLIPEEE